MPPSPSALACIPRPWCKKRGGPPESGGSYIREKRGGLSAGKQRRNSHEQKEKTDCAGVRPGPGRGVRGGRRWPPGGDQDDPLITVSYLQQTAIPDVVAQVEEKAAARQEELKKELEQQIAQYKEDVASLGGTGSGGNASYTLVTLSRGADDVSECGVRGAA